MRRRRRHGGDQGRRGGTAANHHHPLAAVIQVLRPKLGVHPATLKAGLSIKYRLMRLGVTVITTAQVQEPGGHLLHSTLVQQKGDVPATLRGGPVGAQYFATELNLRRDASLVCRGLDVAQDRGAVRNRFAFGPGFEGIAQGVHVGVGAHTGVAKQIPGAAQSGSRLHQLPTCLRAVCLQMPCCANA